MFIQNLQFNSERRQKIFKYVFMIARYFVHAFEIITIILLDDKMHIVV